MASGGQVTKEILSDHLGRLGELLEPGRTAQFNTMSLGPYLRSLYSDSRHVVSKKRSAGTPLDGIVIFVGVPELNEAIEPVGHLRSGGFPYVTSKPGTVAQIRQVMQTACELNEKDADLPPVAMVEGGQAGDHHSWESPPELLFPTYA